MSLSPAQGAPHDDAAGAASPSDGGSKFRRFFKKFGRRPSDEAVPGTEGAAGETQERSARERSQSASDAGALAAAAHGDALKAGAGGQPAAAGAANGKTQRRRASKGAAESRTSTPKARRSFFGSSSNNAHAAATNGTPVPVPALPAQLAPTPEPPATPTAGAELGFAAPRVPDLAGTLQLPASAGAAEAQSPSQLLAAEHGSGAPRSPPPQIEGLPTHEALRPAEILASSSATSIPGVPAREETLGPNALPAPGALAALAVSSAPQTAESAAVAPAHAAEHSFASSRDTHDDDGSSVEYRGLARDSLDARTMDTGKMSRASTKPTTLMSLEREPSTTMAGIATHRHGESSHASGGSPELERREGAGGAPQGNAAPAISFVDPIPHAGGAVHDEPYVSVPSHSRPHPSNNPMPHGMPSDNASVLTLASSTAPASIGGHTGYAASSRHGHQAAGSLGGARSIGGSLMGERRNSSDTYASMKALPPLSRRGSDASSRTGKESVAASATGLSSAQAMSSGASGRDIAAMGYSAGPGAPGDRISVHRTPSQRTVATQLSIPFSASQAAAAQAAPEAQHRAAASLSHAAAADGGAAAPEEAAADTAADAPSAQQEASVPAPQGQPVGV